MLTSCVCACTVTFHLMYNYTRVGIAMSESEAGLQSVSVLGASNLSSALSDSSASSTGNLVSASASTKTSTSTLSNKLRQPVTLKMAHIIRKTQCNPPVGKKHGTGSCSAHAPTNVQPANRVKQYPNKHFIVSAKCLFVLHVGRRFYKKSVIDLHIKSTKYQNRNEKPYLQKRSEQTIAETMKSHDSSLHATGQSCLMKLGCFELELSQVL